MSEKTEILDAIFDELHREAYNKDFHSYDFKRTNQVIRKHFEALQSTPSPALQDAVKEFSRAEIEQLQNKVWRITGDGGVMVLFNQLLSISAA